MTLIEAGEVLLYQGGNVFAAFAQRRQADGEHIDAVVEVGAER
ncbi:hypothetical protein V6243_00680 [Cobetia marina]|uniref:Uncharacterized protein n=1 Tax=Cobetia marina TaxID=28258 RepID=A0ABU9GA24_COBMA